MSGSEPIQPPSPMEPQRHVEEGTGSKPPHFQTAQNTEDPWVKMFAPFGASAEDIEKFKAGVMKMVNDQMTHDSKRALEALKRLKRGED